MSENEDVIKVEGLTKVFNHSLTAVDHINFSVKHGEIFGFLGPNGAGKTTTIKMLITVSRPTEGKATILGGDIAKQSMEVRGAIGVVPQEYTADEDLTGYRKHPAMRRPLRHSTFSFKETSDGTAATCRVNSIQG